MSRAVTDIIREIDRGKFAEAITDELSKLVPACRDTGAVGELTISLKLKPGKGGSAVVEVIPSYKVKQPKTEVPTEIFFATETGALIRDNPDQGMCPHCNGSGVLQPNAALSGKPAGDEA